jgi:glyoxylase-like metal-dependent hydrolase (beta-lactamase superfamily II)
VLERVNETVRYANAPTAIGVVTHGDRALLVDSGLDENLVRKVMNALANEGVKVAAVVNTHAHADHIGGNAFVAKRAPDARVVAPAYEHFFIERPDLEPYTLFGAPGPSSLRGKFLQAQPSRVHEAVEQEGTRDVAGFQVRFHSLPGHSVHQMGVEVDGVLFVGDAILPPAVMEKYGLLFAVDPLEARRSAERVLQVAPRHVVAYHGGLVDDLGEAVRANAGVMTEVETRIGRFLGKGPAAAEDVHADLLDRFPPSHASLELHALQAATVRGYLSALERAGRAEAYLDGRRLLWRLRAS